MQLVLGSRSPQRSRLLRDLFPQLEIALAVPASEDEEPFPEQCSRGELLDQLQRIVATKLDGARAAWSEQCRDSTESGATFVVADSVIVAEVATDQFVVLGKPPEDTWRETTEQWFREYLSDRWHEAITAVCVARADVRLFETVATRVLFHLVTDELMEWYLSTEESRGRAGGYAVQAAGSAFVKAIDGSLSNIVGLPLRETRQMILDVQDR